MNLEQSIAHQVREEMNAAGNESRSSIIISETESLKQCLGGISIGRKSKKTDLNGSTTKLMGGLKKLSGVGADKLDLNGSISGISSNSKLLGGIKKLGSSQELSMEDLNRSITSIASPMQSTHHQRESFSQWMNESSSGHNSFNSFEDSFREQITIGGVEEKAVKHSLAILEKLGFPVEERVDSDENSSGHARSAFDLCERTVQNVSRGGEALAASDKEDKEFDAEELGIDSGYKSDDVDDEGEAAVLETKGRASRKARTERTKRTTASPPKSRVSGSRRSTSPPKPTAAPFRRGSATHTARRSGGAHLTAAPFRRATTSAHTRSSSGSATGEARGAARTRVRDRRPTRGSVIAERQSRRTAEKVPSPVKEELENPKEDLEDALEKLDLKELKKAALERGPSVTKVIANKIRNDPVLMEKFLLEVKEDQDLKSKLGPAGPPSVVNGADCRTSTRVSASPPRAKGGLPSIGGLERSEGKRKVRTALRESAHTPSNIQPGTYRTVVGGAQAQEPESPSRPSLHSLRRLECKRYERGELELPYEKRCEDLMDEDDILEWAEK